MSFTAKELAKRLLTAKNTDAVVCLCVDDCAYSEIGSVLDNTQPADEDGVIGNFLLRLDPKSDLAQLLGDQS